MTGEEFQFALNRLGMTQAEFARLVGYTYPHINNIIQGRKKLPKPLIVIVTLLEEVKILETERNLTVNNMVNTTQRSLKPVR
jgi:plasmid maintenance system antidote protein VapI